MELGNVLRSYRVIFVDGPPASGKTTLILKLRKRTVFRTCRYNSLGAANLISLVLMRLSRDLDSHEVFDPKRTDLVLKIRANYLTRLSTIIFVSEISYKFLQFFKVVSNAALGTVIVDEGIVLRYANYVHLVCRGALTESEAKLLMQLDLRFVLGLHRFTSVSYVFQDSSDENLADMWHRRGHVMQYDYTFLRWVRQGWRLIGKTLKMGGIETFEKQ